MKRLRSLRALAAGGVLLSSVASALAQSSVALTIVHSFTHDGGLGNLGYLQEGLDGNLYGVAPYGGTNETGTIFRITPTGDFSTLHTFGADNSGATNTNTDGVHPFPGLLLNADGSFIGSTGFGGGTQDYGTVFRVTTDGQFSVLYDFGSNSVGTGGGISGLTKGAEGNDYGIAAGWETTVITPTAQYGTYLAYIYKVTPAGAVSIAYNFDAGPDAAPTYVLLASDGNFYGVAGTSGGITSVFRLTPSGTFTTLHKFGDPDAPNRATDGIVCNPGLVQGTDGAFYGTTQSGGKNGTGTVFRITAAGEYSVLYSFDPYNTTPPGGGAYPQAGLLLGRDGNFYGTTYYGGAHNEGTVYQLTPAGAYTTLHSFNTIDGGSAQSLLTQTSDGSIYGSANEGGADNAGVIFKLTTTTHPAFFSGEAALDGDVNLLAFPSGYDFGYYSFLSDPRYIYHYDLGYEYVFDTADGSGGVYFYDFASSTWFYTSPTFPFPYLYDFTLDSVLYYYPDPTVSGRYNLNGVRTFYDFKTGQRITK